MSNVVPLIRPEAVDQAWERFRVQSEQMLENNRLIADRAFMEELARREREWKRLFWASEAK